MREIIARVIFHCFRCARRYLLQHDDDAFEVLPIKHNIVQEMRENKQTMGGYCRCAGGGNGCHERLSTAVLLLPPLCLLLFAYCPRGDSCP